MAHPYRDAAHKNDPSWVKSLAKDKAIQSDNEATIRNYGSNPSCTEAATYRGQKDKPQIGKAK